MRRWQLWVGLIISLFFLVWVFRRISSPEEVWAAFGNADYVFVIPALVAYFVGVWFRALRWQCLLAPLKTVTAGRLFPVVVIGYMANNVLPARMGEFVRAYVLGEKEGIGKGASLATILIERIIDGVVLLMFAVAGSFFIPLGDRLQLVVGVAAMIFGLAITVFLFAAFRPNAAMWAIGVALKASPPKLRSPLSRAAVSFIDGLHALQEGRLLARVLVLSVMVWICEATMYYAIGLGFNLGQPFFVFLLATGLTNLGTMVPSSPGYVGTFDVLLVSTLELFNVNPNLAMSYTLVLHIALLVPVTLLGFFFLWQHHLSLAVVGRQAIVTNTNLQEKESG